MKSCLKNKLKQPLNVTFTYIKNKKMKRFIITAALLICARNMAYAPQITRQTGSFLTRSWTRDECKRGICACCCFFARLFVLRVLCLNRAQDGSRRVCDTRSMAADACAPLFPLARASRRRQACSGAGTCAGCRLILSVLKRA